MSALIIALLCYGGGFYIHGTIYLMEFLAGVLG